MDRQAFISQLELEGFKEITTVTREPDAFLDSHTHPFEAKALILSGEIRIQAQGSDVLYREGDVFHLASEMPHAERYGPLGVSYLVGRK